MKTILFNDLVLLRRQSGIATYADELLRHLRDYPSFNLVQFSRTLEGTPLRWASQAYGIWSEKVRPSFSGSEKEGRTFLNQAYREYARMARWRHQSKLYHEPDLIPLWESERLLVTAHDLSVVLFPEWHPEHRRRLYEKKVQNSVEQAALILSVSQTTCNDLIRVFGISSKKIRVVPLAPRPIFRKLQSEYVQSILSSLNLKKGYVLYVGNIEPRKNILGLIQAYLNLPSQVRNRHPLVLAGGWAWMNDDVRNLLNSSPLKEQVRTLGYLNPSQLVGVMNGASVLIYPSFYEGFGFPPLEAMACEIPVISSRRGALQETVGDAALIVEPEDIDDLTRKMHRILEDKRLSETLVKKGSEQVKKFDWRRTANETRAAYDSLF